MGLKIRQRTLRLQTLRWFVSSYRCRGIRPNSGKHSHREFWPILLNPTTIWELATKNPESACSKAPFLDARTMWNFVRQNSATEGRATIWWFDVIWLGRP